MSMVGFEPTTTRLKVRCSNQLSYIPLVLKFNFTKKKINKNKVFKAVINKCFKKTITSDFSLALKNKVFFKSR